MASIRKQIHNNAVALISVTIAIGALGYNTWRNETTEHQRNVRLASFRILEELGDLQEAVDYRFYYLPFEGIEREEGRTRLHGFGSVSLIRDLTFLMPAPAPDAGYSLQETWNQQVNFLDELTPTGNHTGQAREANKALTESIQETREAVLKTLSGLE